MGTRVCRVGDLKPGMSAYDEFSGRYISIERVEIDGTLVSLRAASYRES